MKVRKSNYTTHTSINPTPCCVPTVTSSITTQSSKDCCVQPKDGSMCCEPNHSKEVNALATGCC